MDSDGLLTVTLALSQLQTSVHVISLWPTFDLSVGFLSICESFLGFCVADFGMTAHSASNEVGCVMGFLFSLLFLLDTLHI